MSNPLYDVITVREGEDQTRLYRWTNIDDGSAVDVTGMSAAMMVRADIDDPTPVLSIASPSKILLAPGYIAVVVSPADAAVLGDGLRLRRRGPFNLIVTNADGTKATEIEGVINFKRSSTR